MKKVKQNEWAVGHEEDEERRHWDYHYDQIGTAPGTLVIDEDASPTELTLIDYSEKSAVRRMLRSPEEAAKHMTSSHYLLDRLAGD